LSLRRAPAGSAAGGSPMIMRRLGDPGAARPDLPGTRMVRRVVPASPPAAAADAPDSGAADPPWAAEARRQNFGLGRAEILPGNVGYLEITGFMEAPGYEEVLVAALRFLERTDALI